MSLLLLTSGTALSIPVAAPTQTLASVLTTATSSALQLADLALVWSGNRADLTVVDSDLACDQGLATAVLLSIFTDRRALDDDDPPSGDSQDRRGWWADQFAEIEGDKFGSRLWLLDRSKRTQESALRANEYAAESLAWLIEDGVCSGVDLEIDPKTALLIGVSLQRPGKDDVSIRFAHVWNGFDASISGG